MLHRYHQKTGKRMAAKPKRSRKPSPKITAPRFRPIRSETMANARGQTTAAAAREKRPTLPEGASERAREAVSKPRGTKGWRPRH